MENADENIDDLRQRLEKANAELARLSEYVKENEKSTQLSDNKIERLQKNVTVLERQLDVAVTEKFNCAKKLSEVEVQRENVQRELDKLKLRHEKQETKLKVLREEVESISERKREVFTKFKLLKSQEMVHDTVVGALKSQFEQKIRDFLKEDSSATDYLTIDPTNADALSEYTSASTSDNPISGSTSTVRDLVLDDGSNAVEPRSIESISDYNHCRAMEAVRGKTQVVRYNHMSMRKTSGTVINRSTLTRTSTSVRATATKSIKTPKLQGISPSTAIAND